MSKQNTPAAASGGGKEETQKGSEQHKSEKADHGKAPGGGGKSNVVSIGGAGAGTSGCLAQGCKKKIEKAGFCLEHFDWFKEGLITKEGRKPTDFDKKYFNYMNRKKPAA